MIIINEIITKLSLCMGKNICVIALYSTACENKYYSHEMQKEEYFRNHQMQVVN